MRITTDKGTLNIKGRLHVIQYGESLYTIAGRYGINVKEILDYNDHIDEENLLFPGEALFIPNPPVAASQSVKKKKKKQ